MIFLYIWICLYGLFVFLFKKKKMILINKVIYCFLYVCIVLLKILFIKRRIKNLISNICEWIMFGNVKMVIVMFNDEINYCNYFVVFLLMNCEVILKIFIWMWFELDKWIKLGRFEIVLSLFLKDNEKLNLSMRRMIIVKYYFIYIIYILYDKCFIFKI